ncbi:phage tail-collar fiber domain-containing protein [Novosphingopyxis sp. YJ-S2-01]|uniref:phage tail-collar fiber domain-containing protein n=1 Tax=Novosphingopyxis sp. YJ-S2-01 TaxID=2794021 RepID=UPI0018DE4E31|nr:phage tail protein [Novosphingopyxis sp. YJ-S2-01]MBH9537902.1 phage tail protein [Novosphingopyxis sp. YJ-S2-01]
MPTALITDIGLTKIRTAAGSAGQVAISHVALGDGLGAVYSPSAAQQTLRRELARVPITKRQPLGRSSWRVIAEFLSDTPAFDVREMGFFDTDGALVSIWAGLDIAPRRTGAIDYIVEHVLDFSRAAEGLVIVDAPDDELYAFAVQSLRAEAITANELHAQRLAITALRKGN